MKRTTFCAVVMAVAAVACASAPVSAADAPNASPSATVDMRALEGKWDGWFVGETSSPLEVVINADGSYRSRIGSESGEGTVRIVNGAIVAAGHLNGSQAPLTDRTAKVTLVEKNGTQMLIGNGRDSSGPYSFTLTMQ
jgi:hypothetical protein